MRGDQSTSCSLLRTALAAVPLLLRLWAAGRVRYTDGMPIDPPETVEADSKNVMCDGNGATSGGHPRVYLTMGADDHVDCPYCDRRFVLKAGAQHKAGAH